MVQDRTLLVNNVVEYCIESPKRVAILGAVRKASNYEQVARSVAANPAYASQTLNRLEALGAVEPVAGKRGYFRQTRLMRTVDVMSEVSRAKRAHDSPATSHATLQKIVTKPNRRKLQLNVPYFSPDDLKELNRNSDAYAVLYAFENSVRNFISTVAIEHHGLKWWDLIRISAGAQKNIIQRMNEDQNDRWHERRKAHPLFYTDFKDLESIIVNNWNTFKSYFPRADGQFFVRRVLSPVLPSRNIIAHTNPITSREAQRLNFNLQDWKHQLGLGQRTIKAS